jgi:NIMA-interacting peptidyl-prolyl cis-trans isomerase 1
MAHRSTMRAPFGALLALGWVACSERGPDPTLVDMRQPPTDLVPPRDPPRALSTRDVRLAARHVLVAYAGAAGAAPTVTRSREEARTRAEEALTWVRQGANFERVARLYSDDAGSVNYGGDLPPFSAGEMVPPFEQAVRALAVGDVHPTTVESPFGFHVIRREPLRELRASVLVVGWDGAVRAPSGLGRTREAARARAGEARAALDAGAPWADVVATYSDGATRDDAGDLGWIVRGTLARGLDEAAFDLALDAYSPVLEVPQGCAIVKRTD